MRILIICDHIDLPSGLARVGRHVRDALDPTYEITYLPTGKDFGRWGFADTVSQIKPDIVITIGDPFHFEYLLDMRRGFHWCFYVTIDAINYFGRLPNRWVRILATADTIMCPSRFGCAVVSYELGKKAVYIPYGSDIIELDALDAQVNRERWGLDDAFVLISVNRNLIRKRLFDALKVMSGLKLTAPSEHFKRIAMVMRAQPNDPYGVDLASLVSDYRLENSVRLIDDGDLAEIYSLAAYGRGTHLYASGAEGFGLTALESMSCHVPVIASDYSAMAEVCHGVLIEPSGFMTVDQGVEHAIFDVEGGMDTVLSLYNDYDKTAKLAEGAYNASLSFSWEKSMDILKDVISDVTTYPKPVAVSKKTPNVTLIIEEETPYLESTYYPISEAVTVKAASEIYPAIADAKSRYVAIAFGVIPQRGWLSELVRLMTADVAVVSSTIIGRDGRIIEGEFYLNDDDDMYYLNEGSLTPNTNREAFSFPFRCVLIDKESLALREDMEFAVSGMAASILAKANEKTAIISYRSVALCLDPTPFEDHSMQLFKLAIKPFLDEIVKIVYRGPRESCHTEFGFFEREKSRDVSKKQAILLCTKYPNFEIDTSIEKQLALSIAMERGGRIKIGRPQGFGDVIMALLFAASPLKKANPKIHLTFVTNRPYCGFVKSTGLVDEVLEYPQGMTDNTSYDYVLDLAYLPEHIDPASKQNRPKIFAQHLAGYEDFSFDAYMPSQRYSQGAAKWFDCPELDGNKKTVGIQVLCTSPVRTYPPDYMAKLIQLFIESGYNVALFGLDPGWGLGYMGWNGKNLISFVDQVPELEMNAALMSYCDYFVAPDSGLLHLAGFMKIPTLGLFGNIPPENRIAYYPTVKALYPKNELPCIPCGDIYNPCPECSNMEARGAFSGKCMRLLVPERVIEGFNALILGENGDDRSIELPLLSTLYEDCPICKAPGPFKEVNRLFYWDEADISDGVIFVQCSSCEGVFANPTFSQPTKYEEGYFMSGRSDRFYSNILGHDSTGRAQDTIKVHDIVRNYQKGTV